MQNRTLSGALVPVGLCLLVLALLATAVQRSEAQTPFDHFTTGFRLVGAHQYADCESCHNNGVFTGTPATCDGCHSQASRIRATWQPPRHIRTTERCDGCHRPVAWVPVARVDHFETVGSCSSCHDNFRARGQHPQHIPTTGECDSCHNTRFWRL